MNQPLRLFYAIEVPEEIRTELVKFGVTLERPWQMVKPEQMHITMAFMGEVPEAELDKVIKAGEAVAACSSKFSVEVVETAFFPESGEPKVLYAKVSSGSSLSQLAESLRSELGNLADGKKFKAHLTLARSRGDWARKMIRKFRGNWQVDAITLFKSIQVDGSTRHECVQRFPLK